jgi:crotonobetainyl-CoA:carnitine CoA-transferase CaiB-like acyl-CoA transferase
VAGTFLHEGVVPRLSDTPGAIRRAAPRLGEHTREVLGEWLGMTGTELEHLAAGSVLE